MNREELINDALNSGNVELLDKVDKLSFDELENELASNDPIFLLKKQIRLLTTRVNKLENNSVETINKELFDKIKKAYKVKELKEVLKDNGVKIPRRAKEDDLITLLFENKLSDKLDKI